MSDVLRLAGDEKTRYGNTTILEGSRQAGFLGAAMIAAWQFWTAGEVARHDRAAMVLFVLSISCSIGTHLVLGGVHVYRGESMLRGTAGLEGETILSALWLGILQGLLMIAGVLCAAF